MKRPRDESAAAPTPHSPRSHRGRKLVIGLLMLPVVLVLAALAALAVAWQSLHTERGTRWWLAVLAERMPGVVLSLPRGALLGGAAPLTLDRASLRLGQTSVSIDSLSLDGLALGGWRLEAPFVQVSARALTAGRVAVEFGAADKPAARATPPEHLRLPVAAKLEHLRIDELHLAGLPAPLEALEARLEAGAVHRVEALSLRWRGMRLAGRAQVDAAAPMATQAQLALRPDPLADAALPLPWARDVALDLALSGPLAQLDASLSLGMNAQRAEASARLTPFEALPLSRLDTTFAALDLKRLLAPFGVVPAPTTELSGNLVVQLDATQPLLVRLQATNAAPGRWDQGRLPLGTATLRASGQGRSWQIEQALLGLQGDTDAPAGSVEASGRIDGQAAELRLALAELRLERLDSRAPPLRLSGRVDLRHAPHDAVATSASAAAPAAFGQVDFDAQLEGALLGATRARAPRPLRERVQFALRGSATPGRAVIDALDARAGTARLDGKARVERTAERWETQATLRLTGFDPSKWLPGEPTATWRQSRNALSGSAQLKAGAAGAAQSVAALLASLRGTLAVQLSQSMLAGQPIALSLDAEADGQGRLSAKASARAADNTAKLSAQVHARALGAAGGAIEERFALELDAPSLAQLAPLADALGQGRLAGRARIAAQAEGPLGAWLFGGAAAGALATRGSADLAGLRWAESQLDEASAEWNATLPGRGEAANAAWETAAVQGRLRLAGLRTVGLSVPRASLQAEGSLAEHRITLDAALRQPQPTGTAPGSEPAPLQLNAGLLGQWQAGRDGTANRWLARIGELRLEPVAAVGSGGSAVSGMATKTAAAVRAVGDGAPHLPLLVAREIALELQQGASALRMRVQAGSAQVLGAVLRWSELSWERQGEAAARLRLEAEVEPLLAAPLLQRFQADFGWSGDLLVGARLSVQSDPAVSVRVEVARRSGDLQVKELGSVQALGLTDARLALEADGGVWRFTQLVAGAQLGRVSGQQTVRTGAERLWPAPDASLSGEIAIQVDKLETWGAWVPAGWRLGGQLEAALRVAGRLNSPELRGEVRGRQLAVRNTLEGVALNEGELEANFDGVGARLQALRFRAGEGWLEVTGDARLGAEPQARLEVTAKRATLLGRVDRRVVASGAARIVLDAHKTAVNGALRLDEGLIDISRSDAPALGDDVTVRRAGDPPEEDSVAPSPRLARSVDMKLSLDLGPRLHVRGRGIDTRLEGQLELTSPEGRLTARGEIRTDRGTYAAYGQDLEIARGVITFVGDIANPRLDIEAVRGDTDTRVGVIVGGNVAAPRIRLFSQPELPATEQLALLVTGRSYDSLAGNETLLLQRAALALLAGDGSEGNRFDVARMLQLDELSVRQGEGAVRDTFVTLGKQISERVYLGYERGLSTAAGNFQLIYRIARRFTLRAQSGDDPAVDLIWLFRWN